jgi:Bax protein
MKARDIVFVSTVFIGMAIGFWRLQGLDQVTEQPVVIPERQFLELTLPDFQNISDAKSKKTRFFEFVKMLADDENQRIMQQRQMLLSLLKSSQLSDKQQQWLASLAEEYRYDGSGDELVAVIKALLKRVDIVPVSLVLSQAANESAWGTSRFAVEGNNLFGQWCFKPGCGMIPLGRPQGARYEVARYDSPRQSVTKYISNLNTNSAYQSLRTLRAEQRRRQQPLAGEKLAQGLLKYSSRGEEYVKELVAMIRFNKLAVYDTL